MSRQGQKRCKFVEFLCGLQELSTCSRYQHAAIVVDDALTRVHSIGFNGVPSGIAHVACSGDADPCICVHAEANALIKLDGGSDLTMLITTTPCAKCAGMIINSGRIRAVVYGKAHSASGTIGTAIHMLLGVGISVVRQHDWTHVS